MVNYWNKKLCNRKYILYRKYLKIHQIIGKVSTNNIEIEQTIYYVMQNANIMMQNSKMLYTMQELRGK